MPGQVSIGIYDHKQPHARPQYPFSSTSAGDRVACDCHRAYKLVESSSLCTKRKTFAKETTVRSHLGYQQVPVRFILAGCSLPTVED